LFLFQSEKLMDKNVHFSVPMALISSDPKRWINGWQFIASFVFTKYQLFLPTEFKFRFKFKLNLKSTLQWGMNMSDGWKYCQNVETSRKIHSVDNITWIQRVPPRVSPFHRWLIISGSAKCVT
jgi:hypothetical protein